MRNKNHREHDDLFSIIKLIIIMPILMAILLLLIGENAECTENTWVEVHLEDKEEEIIVKEAYQDFEESVKIEQLADSENKNIDYEVSFFEVTAYTAGFESCGKLPSDPLYGHTALSGRAENNLEPAMVIEWQSIAAPKSIPFGTKLFIPAFEDMPNKGLFIVDDRGGDITEGRLDIYMSELSDALAFGRQELEVWIIEEAQ